MHTTQDAASERRPRPLRYIDLPRAVAAALLLAGLFALLFFILLPRGDSDGSVRAARIVDTPPGAEDAAIGVHPGDLARDFEASNLEDGRLRLSDLRGRPLVINFWATWCTSCLAEMPVLEQQRLAHEAEGLTIVAVNVGEGVGDARRFIEELELFDFVIAMDPDLTIADAYGVRGLPDSVFIDSNGVIEAEYRGQLDEETMGRYVQAAIEAVPGGEAPGRLRIVTTVPREHVLEVIPSEGDPGQALFVSRRFRCDDDYCGVPLVERVRGTAGVLAAELVEVDSSPALSVSFDPATIELDELATVLAEALRTLPDPLYTRELEVRYPGGQRP